MNHIREILRRRQSYEPIDAQGEAQPLRVEALDEVGFQSGYRDDEDEQSLEPDEEFSWANYAVFLLLGVAMLWAWNMFIASGPYFKKRFQANEWVLQNFQPAELVASTTSNLSAVLIFANLQAKASYSRRVVVGLLLNSVVFTLLAMSTKLFLHVSSGQYFAFIIVQVLFASFATGILQNGLFAYASGFGREEYTQAIMAGQAVAGVLPAMVQIVSVLSVPESTTVTYDPEESSTSALIYFITATAISLITLLAFFPLVMRHYRSQHRQNLSTSIMSMEGSMLIEAERKRVPLLVLFRKTFWLATSLFLGFGITMVFPVFTQKIFSVRDPGTAGRLFKNETFVPLALLFWNAGDLIGRMLPAIHALRTMDKPRLVFFIAISRVAFIPLYLMCNIEGHGAVISSDFFYLVVVQLLFGISNGFIGTTCMMGAVEYVEPEEREAAGAFMGLCLVSGLAAGSLMSFLVAG
ncbi:hypothetical protein EJ06DRAFT_529839 [Trichodelitschia bisporula]|uniref:Nucleoside transporter family n=1 Tax=Trichodelitschia bisporula TaxID=703511 RepID=A0A6G1HXE9_9PEZI|nr:hypothetical protein EJ06DRAFT_529839 [Trichodelitschia bisporula]